MSKTTDRDGNPVEPLGWQGSGIDWEVYTNQKPLRANGYDEDVLIEVVTARTRIGLGRKMRRAQKRHGMTGTVFG